MAIKTQGELEADIAALFADNDAGAISAEDLRTFLVDLVDTAEDLWGPGALSDSPPMSPSMSEAKARIAEYLADCGESDDDENSIPAPDAYAGLITWLDPTDTSTMWQDVAKTIPVTTIGDTVQYWEDKSGNGKDWSNGSAGSSPTWQGDHLLFNSDFLSGPSYSGMTGGTRFMRVITPAPISSQNGGWIHLMGGYNTSGVASTWVTSTVGTGGDHRWGLFAAARQTAGAWSTLGFAYSDDIVHVETHDGTDANLYFNNTLIDTKTYAIDDPEITLLGAVRNVSGVMTNGQFYGLLLYDNQLSTTDREYISNNFADTVSGGSAPASSGSGGVAEDIPAQADLLVWLDPADNSTMWQDVAKTTPVTADGDPIAYWADKSGNGNDWTQSDDARRPTWKTTEVRFQEDWLVGPDLSAYTSGSMVARVQVADQGNLGGSGGGLFHIASGNSSATAAHYDTSVSTTGGLNYACFSAATRPIGYNWGTSVGVQDSTEEHTYTLLRPSAGLTLTCRVSGETTYSPQGVSAGTMGTEPLIGTTRRLSAISQWAIRDASIKGGGFLLYSSELTGTDLTDAEAFVETTYVPPAPPPPATGGCISPADLRGAVSPVVDLFYPDAA